MLLSSALGQAITPQEVATELKFRGYYPITAIPALSPPLSRPIRLITTPLSPPVSLPYVKIIPSVSPVVIPIPEPIAPISPTIFEPIWEPVSPVPPVTPFVPMPDPPPFVIDEFPFIIPEPIPFIPLEPVSPSVSLPVVVDAAADSKGVWMLIAALGAVLIFGKDKKAQRLNKKRISAPTRRELTA